MSALLSVRDLEVRWLPTSVAAPGASSDQTEMQGAEGRGRPWVGADARPSVLALWFRCSDRRSRRLTVAEAPSRGEGRARPGLVGRADQGEAEAAPRSAQEFS